MKQGATGKMHPHTQAELVDGFLAWDFDADTAATFFAQQGSRIQQLVAAR